jgi:hypothetical protein
MNATLRVDIGYAFAGCAGAIVVVDPISTGANVADVILRRGLQVIAITSGEVQSELPIDPALRSTNHHTMHSKRTKCARYSSHS